MSAPPPKRARVRKTANTKFIEPVKAEKPPEPAPEQAPVEQKPVKKLRQRISKKTTTPTTSEAEMTPSASNDSIGAPMDIISINECDNHKKLKNLKLYEMTDIMLKAETKPSKTVGLKQAVREEMEQREKDYKNAPKVASKSFADVTKSFAGSMMDLSANIAKKSTPLENLLKRLDFSSVQVDDNYFKPDFAFNNSIFEMGTEELYEDVTNSEEVTPLKQMQKALNAEDIIVSEGQHAHEPSVIDQINQCYTEAVVKYTTGNYIDLSKSNSLKLVFNIAKALFNPSRKNVYDTALKIAKTLQESSMVRINLTRLSISMGEILSKLLALKGQTEPKLAVFLVCELIHDFTLSSFIRYVGSLPSLKKKMFFDDSFFNDGDNYIKMAETIEQIESCTVIGTVNTNEIPTNFMISCSDLVKRIHGIVQTRSSDLSTIMKDSIRLSFSSENSKVDYLLLTFLKALLLQNDGTVAKYENLWDILLAAASLTDYNHPRYAEFVSLINTARNTGKNTKDRIMKAIVNLLNDNFYHLLFIFVYHNYKSVKVLQNSLVFNDPETVIRIAFELGKLQGIQSGIGPDAFTKTIEKL